MKVPMRFKYRPDVDGLRAVAIILVLLYHAGIAFPGGFIGVDVFFVISGFLITGLILKEQESDTFLLAEFWIRRIRRILPASTFAVIVTFVAGMFLLLPTEYDELAKSTVSQQLMLSNVFFWRTTGYFAGPADFKPLLHTWSLAVEEQFYLIYPIFLVVTRRWSIRLRVTSILVTLLLSLAASEWGTYNYQSATFYLLPTRAWELLVGALLCFVPANWHSNALCNNIVSFVGISAIGIAAICFDSTTRFPGTPAILPCAGASCLILSNSKHLTFVGRILAQKTIVFIGLMSYSMYLWHWPFLAYARLSIVGEPLPLLIRVICLCATLLAAYMSWRFIETPFRRKQLLLSHKRLYFVAGVSQLVLLSMAGAVIMYHGIPNRFDKQVVAFEAARNSKQHLHSATANDVVNSRLPVIGSATSSSKWIVWGDSHAMALVTPIDYVCKAHGIQLFQATRSLTPPILNLVPLSRSGRSYGAPEFNRAVVDFAKKNHVEVVILSAYWSTYKFDASVDSFLRETIRELVDSDIRVVIVRDVATQKGDVPSMLARALNAGREVSTIGVPIAEHRQINQQYDISIDQLASENVTILDPAPYFLDESGIWRAAIDGVSMYRDQDHLSIPGGLRLVPLFETIFRK